MGKNIKFTFFDSPDYFGQFGDNFVHVGFVLVDDKNPINILLNKKEPDVEAHSAFDDLNENRPLVVVGYRRWNANDMREIIQLFQ